jgi:hypothetical protein
MPGSVIFGKKIIDKWLKKQKDIKTIVDIGAGMGNYPKLFGGAYQYIAIEIWAPYIEQYNLHELYKEIIVGDVRHIKLPKGDCAILGDIVEHLPKDDALKVLDRVDKKYKHVIISIPVGGMVQGSSQGNKFEAHLSFWEFQELSNILKHYKVKKQEEYIGVFIK